MENLPRVRQDLSLITLSRIFRYFCPTFICSLVIFDPTDLCCELVNIKIGQIPINSSQISPGRPPLVVQV